MWKTIKYGCKASWFMIGGLWLTALMVLYVQKQAFYELPYDHMGEQAILFPMKSWIFLAFLVCSCLAICVYMQYLMISTGKVRYMLLRNHRMEWALGNTLLVFVILMLCYILMVILLKDGLHNVISSSNDKATMLAKQMIYQKTLESDPHLSMLLVMDLCHTGKILLWLFALSMWTHAFAINRILRTQRILDVLITVSILPLLLSFFHWTSIPLSLFLCVCDLFYIQRCWEPKRMYS